MLRAVSLPLSRRLQALALASLLAASAFSATAPQDKKGQSADNNQEAVRLHSDLVVVTATVTDRAGQYAHGLTAKDFVILEDGAPQALNSFASEEAPFAASILIDMSGSMGYKFGLARAAAATFIDSIRDDDQVAVYGFNRKVQLFQDFSNSRDISEYIWDAKAEDTTKLYDCMSEALDALAKRTETRRAILLISDGWDSASARSSLDSVMKKALAAGVVIYSLDLIDNSALMGSGSEVVLLRRGRKDMQEFAAQTGGLYVHSPQGDKLEQAFANIVDELRNQYTLTYYPANEKRDGRWRKLSLSVNRADLSTRTRRGYWAPKDK